MIKSFEEGLILINNGDVADFVDLMESLESVLDQLGEVDCRLDSIRNSLNDDSFLLVLSLEEIPCSLEVSSNSDSSSDSDFVLREGVLSSFDLSISFRHL